MIAMEEARVHLSICLGPESEKPSLYEIQLITISANKITPVVITFAAQLVFNGSTPGSEMAAGQNIYNVWINRAIDARLNIMIKTVRLILMEHGMLMSKRSDIASNEKAFTFGPGL